MAKDHALQFRVWLWGIEPQIWRRLLLSPELNFAELHEVIQAAFGWEDSHMHQFTIGGLAVGAPEINDDDIAGRRTLEAAEVKLRDLDFRRIASPYLLYEYDFGDAWVHQLDLETRVQFDRPEMKAAVLGGERAGPPEDCGGRHSYGDFVLSLKDPHHSEHRQNRAWVGKAFDPEKFDLGKTQKAVDRALAKCRGDYLFRQRS